MEYFRMRQSVAVHYVPRLKNVYDVVDKRDINVDHAQKLKDPLFFRIDTAENPFFPDVMDQDLFLVSRRLMSVLGIYVRRLPYISVVLVDPSKEISRIYYMPIWKEINCLDEDTLYNLDKSVITKLVMNESLIGDEAIFRIKHGVTPIVIVRLDVAESILRRDLNGISFERICLNKRSIGG